MANIVTFDGPNKIITEVGIPASPLVSPVNFADQEHDVVEIYSEWKEWVILSDNAKYLQAFTPVGGDPITLTQSLGITYFLENGWRIRPAEGSHKYTLVGNIFTREPGQSAFVTTVGAFTVNAETRVSNLIDTLSVGSGLSTEQALRLSDIWQRLGMDVDTPVVYKDDSIVVGSITLTVTQTDADTTTVDRLL